MHPQPKRPSWTASFWAPVAALALLGGAYHAWCTWHPSFLQPVRKTVYRQTADGWQKLPPLPDRIDVLRVSDRGTVWAQAFTYESGDVFARLDGASWRIYRAGEFGLKYLYASGFVLDGEDAWATTSDGVLHWDGRHWQLNRDLHVSSIVAAAGRAWAKDRTGHLFQYEAGHWTALGAQPPDEKWNQTSYWDLSPLARTSDGALWLKGRRLWRFNGSAWHIVTAAGGGNADWWFAGATADHIWIGDAGALRSISMDGKTQVSYTAAQTGLSARDVVADAVSHGGHTWFSTWYGTYGVLEFDGVGWRRIALPRDGVQSVSNLRVGPGGQLFAVGRAPNPAWKYLPARGTVALLLVLATLATIAWMVRWFQRDRLHAYRSARPVMECANLEARERLQQTERRLERESSWWNASATVGLPVASLIGFSLLRIFWRSAPSWIFLVLAAALHTAYVLWRSLRKRTPKPSDPIEPGGPGYDWNDVVKALPGTLLLFCLMSFDALRRFTGDPIRGILYAAGGWAVCQFVLDYSANAALKRGDYDAALNIARWMRFVTLDRSQPLRLRGLALLLAGRYREAEENLRLAIAATKSGAEQARTLENLGDSLMEQGRYDEASGSYEAALRSQTGYLGPYRGMAELLLRRHQDPQRALEFVENSPSGPAWNRWTLTGDTRDDYWALKAWALAELGRTGEVGPAIENAMRATNRKSRPAMAATFYRAGMAMQALGKDKPAAEYFTRARAADPKGRWNGAGRQLAAGCPPALFAPRTPPGT